jgi:peptidoglycan/LPS O-acetylase OafA/YrhL
MHVVADPAQRSNNFDFLRFALATLVIFSHSFALLHGSDATEPLMRATHQLPSGDLAVDGFFVISGFLVTHSWMRSKTAAEYAGKRIRRIYPGFAVALLVSAFIVGPLSSPDPGVPFRAHELAKLLRAMVTLRADIQQYAFPDNPYPHSANGSLWTIFYEVACYVGVAGLGAIGLLKRRRIVALMLLASIAGCFALTAAGPAQRLSFTSTPLVIPVRLASFFLAGMTAYLYRDRIRFSTPAITAAGIGLLVGAVLPHALVVGLPLCGAYLLFAFAFSKRIRLQSWATRGDFSYGIYLYAFPIQQLCIHYNRSWHPLVLFCVATPLAIVAGMLSWWCVEKRFLRMALGPYSRYERAMQRRLAKEP